MKTFIFFIILCSTVISFGQVAQQWASRYAGTGNGADDGFSVTIDLSGNVYVTGASWGGSSGYDYATVKYNSSGVQQWAVSYNGPANLRDEANSIAVDNSGNVYVTGRSEGSGSGYDCATVKYNSSGVQQWASRYNGPGNAADWGKMVGVDNLGNVFVTGYGYGSGTTEDFHTIKYNSSGVQQWVERYNGPGNMFDEANFLYLDGAGFIYVTGNSYGSGTGYDYATIKYNSAGTQQWLMRYTSAGSNDDNSSCVKTDASGNVYVTGKSFVGTSYNYATIKYNSSGAQQWAATYNSPGNGTDEPRSLAVDGSGNVFVTGSSTSSSGYDYLTVKYNSSGAEQWTQRYNGAGNSVDIATSMVLDAAGNVYVTGAVTIAPNNFDYATLKYNTSGVQQWIQTYNGPGSGDDISYSIAIDFSNNVYVAGSSLGSGTDNDYAVIKYAQFVGISSISGEVPHKFSLSQNYPNPFNPETKIKFAVPKSGFVNISVYDILGRKIESLVNENLNPGTYEVNWNATEYPSGIYYYKLTAGEYSETRKMILLK